MNNIKDAIDRILPEGLDYTGKIFGQDPGIVSYQVMCSEMARSVNFMANQSDSVSEGQLAYHYIRSPIDGTEILQLSFTDIDKVLDKVAKIIRVFFSEVAISECLNVADTVGGRTLYQT
jgi:hypothetical protein